MMKYEILTSVDAWELSADYDNMTDEEYNNAIDNLWNEQIEVLQAHGFVVDGCKCYDIHFLEDNLFHNDRNEEMPIDEAIESNAIKEGFNVVKFENGNIGVVASYNCNLNGFEILGEATEEE